MRSNRGFPAPQIFLLAIVAWAVSGYTPPPLMRNEINLQPASTCKSCHLDITEQWQRSAHARADRTKNPLFGRMYFYSLKATRGRTMTACGPCHETASFVNQDFEFVREASQEGVTCVFCHYVSGPSEEKGIPAYTLDLAAYHGSVRGPVVTPAHKSAFTTYLGTSEFCGTCHTYSNQNKVKIADTYGEWKRSRYAKQGTGCQSCHMPGAPGRNSNQGPPRPRVADHSFSETVAAARPNTATLALTGGRRAGRDSLRVTAIVTNTGWGHSLPTGNDQKLALIRIRVLDGAGKILWENDPFEEWNVSIFGLILADEVGNWPADTWNAVKTISDRRIKAGGSARVRYDVPLAGTRGPLRVEAQLLYRQSKPATLVAYGLDEETYGAERTLAEATLRVP